MSDKNYDIIEPINQLQLFGYSDYFNSLIKIIKKKNQSSSMLISGPKGIGKSTFIYHIINYLLSLKEKDSYSIETQRIDKKNYSFNHLISNTHPNFFLIKNKIYEKDIKVENIRNLMKFINKSTYSRDLKIVMIDNAENLNINSSNALLKVIEEPTRNTFFFIVHDSFKKISETLKSRCIYFKLNFTFSEKKEIFKKIINSYREINISEETLKNLHFDTPGNLLKYCIMSDELDIKIEDNKLENIIKFIKVYITEKNPDILNIISILIQKYYLDMLDDKHNKNLISISNDYSKILRQFYNIKNFNLNVTHTLLYIKNILLNETR